MNTKSRKTCNYCGETIHFVTSRKVGEFGEIVTGKPIPCNTELRTGDGFTKLVAIYPTDIRGFVVPNADNETQGYISHFATCTPYLERQRLRRQQQRLQAVQTELF